MAWVTPKVWTSEAVRFLVTRAHMQEISDSLNALYAGAAYAAFTPAWTNITEGAGANVGRKNVLNKRCQFTAAFTLAGDSSVGGSIYLDLPVTAVALPAGHPMGLVTFLDASPAVKYVGAIIYNSTTTVQLVYTQILEGDPASFVAANATGPITFTTGDKILVSSFPYETA